MSIRTRRWNDPKQPGDGHRVLVCRYRPRALKKEDDTWDVWIPVRVRGPGALPPHRARETDRASHRGRRESE